MNIIKFDELSNEDQLEINRRLIVKLADEVGNNYQEYLKGESKDMVKVTESINQFTDALKFIGVKSSHFVNAAMLTGFYHDMANMNKNRGTGECFVYAVYCNETGMTKIGKTTRYYQRMKEIQSLSPNGKLKAILKIKADPKLELILHQKYAGYRQHSEWFCLDERRRADLIDTAKQLAI